jgi:hypothetical protein
MSQLARPAFAEAITQRSRKSAPTVAVFVSDADSIQEARAATSVPQLRANGRGIDLMTAYEYFKEAAVKEDGADAWLYCGVCLLFGRGKFERASERKWEEAAVCFKRSADHGNSEGQFRYGLCLEFGKGVPIDLVSAADYYKKSAEQGDEQGQLKYGLCLENGQGVPLDLISADVW